jgi:hypothetical protein
MYDLLVKEVTEWDFREDGSIKMPKCDRELSLGDIRRRIVRHDAIMVLPEDERKMLQDAVWSGLSPADLEWYRQQLQRGPETTEERNAELRRMFCPEPEPKHWTVTGYYVDNDQVWTHHAEADTPEEAAKNAVVELCSEQGLGLDEMVVVDIFAGNHISVSPFTNVVSGDAL